MYTTLDEDRVPTPVGQRGFETMWQLALALKEECKRKDSTYGSSDGDEDEEEEEGEVYVVEKTRNVRLAAGGARFEAAMVAETEASEGAEPEPALKTLMDLPDELLLMIAERVPAITGAIAKPRNASIGLVRRNRKRVNVEATLALLRLARTNRRMRRIAMAAFWSMMTFTTKRLGPIHRRLAHDAAGERESLLNFYLVVPQQGSFNRRPGAGWLYWTGDYGPRNNSYTLPGKYLEQSNWSYIRRLDISSTALDGFHALFYKYWDSCFTPCKPLAGIETPKADAVELVGSSRTTPRAPVGVRLRTQNHLYKPTSGSPAQWGNFLARPGTFPHLHSLTVRCRMADSAGSLSQTRAFNKGGFLGLGCGFALPGREEMRQLWIWMLLLCPTLTQLIIKRTNVSVRQWSGCFSAQAMDLWHYTSPESGDEHVPVLLAEDLSAKACDWDDTLATRWITMGDINVLMRQHDRKVMEVFESVSKEVGKTRAHVLLRRALFETTVVS